MKIFVSGSLAYDRIMNFSGNFSEHILPEKIHNLNISFLLETCTENFGGTAGNIAYSLALLGEKPVVLATVGNDFEPYRAWMAEHNIDSSMIKVIPREKTSFCYIMTDRSDNQITSFYPGAMKYHGNEIGEGYAAGDTLAIVAPGCMESMKEYSEFYRKNNIPYIYDPGQQITSLNDRDLLHGISGAKVFISNDYELNMVMKKIGFDEDDLLQKVEILITTLGDKGCTIKTKDAVYNIPPAKPENDSDPTGAGDAFRAGFIKGLAQGLPLDVAGRLGSVTAVYTVEKYGTQTHAFTIDGLKKRYKQNFGQDLPI
ncbi:MAG: carbohydrate kinase family protein [Candidatus Paceibacterota bacterium]|jgi:adenosine kinase